MKKSYPQFVYDREAEVLSVLLRRGKSVDSDIQDNVVLDYDNSGNVIRMDVHKFDFNKFEESKCELYASNLTRKVEA